MELLIRILFSGGSNLAPRALFPGFKAREKRPGDEVVADPDLQIRGGGGHPDPEIRWGEPVIQTLR